MLTLISFFVSPQSIPTQNPGLGELDVIGDFQMESILSRIKRGFEMIDNANNYQCSGQFQTVLQPIRVHEHSSWPIRGQEICSTCNDQNKVERGCNFPTLLIH